MLRKVKEQGWAAGARKGEEKGDGDGDQEHEKGNRVMEHVGWPQCRPSVGGRMVSYAVAEACFSGSGVPCHVRHSVWPCWTRRWAGQPQPGTGWRRGPERIHGPAQENGFTGMARIHIVTRKQTAGKPMGSANANVLKRE